MGRIKQKYFPVMNRICKKIDYLIFKEHNNGYAKQTNGTITQKVPII
ncbi:MAG: hypothetical protein KJ770_05935 [Actinobacteria bacterium]|nr:hypothetical protein [Actinomycetota bacterium]MBU4450606.1 hypothetical protein [Actinomycetota bacterium]